MLSAYDWTVLLVSVGLFILVKNIGADLRHEWQDIKAGAHALAVGSGYLAFFAAIAIVAITLLLLAWKLALFAWS